MWSGRGGDLRELYALLRLQRLDERLGARGGGLRVAPPLPLGRRGRRRHRLLALRPLQKRLLLLLLLLLLLEGGGRAAALEATARAAHQHRHAPGGHPPRRRRLDRCRAARRPLVGAGAGRGSGAAGSGRGLGRGGDGGDGLGGGLFRNRLTHVDHALDGDRRGVGARLGAATDRAVSAARCLRDVALQPGQQRLALGKLLVQLRLEVGHARLSARSEEVLRPQQAYTLLGLCALGSVGAGLRPWSHQAGTRGGVLP